MITINGVEGEVYDSVNISINRYDELLKYEEQLRILENVIYDNMELSSYVGYKDEERNLRFSGERELLVVLKSYDTARYKAKLAALAMQKEMKDEEKKALESSKDD
jgi:hypothetical protein